MQHEQDGYLPVIGCFLGKNWHRPIESSGIPLLSIESRMTALALVELLAKERIISEKKPRNGSPSQQTILKLEKAIFSTGHTLGSDQPTEAERMSTFLAEKPHLWKMIPEGMLILEEESFDTANNAEEIAILLQELRVPYVLLVTVSFHLERARKLFENYGIQVVAAVSSEEILATRDAESAQFISDYQRTFRYKLSQIIELAGLLLVETIDKRGKLLRFITTISRRRLNLKSLFNNQV